MPDEIEVTAEGYQRLEESLDKERQRLDAAVTSMAESLDDAMGMEDRNLEAAQFHQETPAIEARIQELEDVLDRAVIVEPQPGQTQAVKIGTVVTLQDEDHDRELQIQLVSAVEVDALADGAKQVSEDSPVGRAVLGRQAGESFEVEVGAGRVRYTVKAIAAG